MSSERGTDEKVVWLVNKGGHDYSSLADFGRVICLTTGAVNPFNPDRLMVNLGHHLSMAKEVDYVAISGVPILNALAIAMWLEKFPHANLLQWSVRAGAYVFTQVSKAALVRNVLDGGKVNG
jgi:hypothetical protein